MLYALVVAAFYSARRRLAVVFPAPPSQRDGVVDARVQGAVSIGGMLDADKLAKDLRGVAVQPSSGVRWGCACARG